jgi:hypothetical protein
MTDLIQIDEVLPASRPGDLEAFALDVPKAGFASDTFALDLRGWMVGAQVRPAAVVVLRNGAVLRRLPVGLERPDVAEAHPGLAGAGRSGFFGSLSALEVEGQFELELEIELQDAAAERAPFARVRGTRAPVVSPFKPRLQPVVLTTLARTGSTAVVRMLAAHPEVVAYRPFEWEPRVATYWVDVFRALTDPAGYRRQLEPTGTIDGTWWLGREQPLPRRLRDPVLGPWLGAAAVGELAAVAQQRIDGLYVQVAAAQERAGASRFVEKYRADTVRDLMLELYPGAREVMLVRDFRDMVASMFAYDVKRGRRGFRRDHAPGDREYVLDEVRTSVDALVRTWHRRSERTLLLRYEDLVLEPHETVPALLAHLGLAAAPETVEQMVATLFDRDRGAEGHRTVSDPRESIGRWQRDLSDELIAACEDALAPSLETFGYEPA